MILKNLKCALFLLKNPYSTSIQRHGNKFRKRRILINLSVGTLSVAAGSYYFALDEKERRKINVVLGGVKRFIRSSCIGISISTDYWWSLRNSDESNPSYLSELELVHQRSAEKILEGCLKNGGLYVKLGQGLVSMDHVLPKEYIQTLKVLQDKCLTRKTNEVHQLFMEDFGKPHTEIFHTFDEVPIAAASLAQVFVATTKEGQKLAVKAQYIDLRDRFYGDVTTVKFLLKIAGAIFPKFDFQWLMHELQIPLEQELDFLNEARNSERCSNELSHLGYVCVPKVRWNESSNRVLTMEFADGIKINETGRLLASGLSLADIDTKLFTTFSEQIFTTGFVHADPHPGNVLVRKGADGEAELVLLDHGLYSELPSENRISLSKLW